MKYSSTVPIELDEIIDFLKKNIQFKEIYEKILHQKIINKAAQERGLTVTPGEIQAQADRQRYEQRLEKVAETLAWLDAQMMTPEQWEAGICDRILAKNLAEHLFAKEVEKFFAQNRLDFDQVLLYQIIVNDGKLAQELFYQLEEREISFYEAAYLYDADEKRRHQCGYVGYTSRWNLKPDIAAAVFGVPLGEVIGPIQTDLGFHLLKVEEFIPAELTPQRYQELLDGMFQQWLASELTYMLHNSKTA